jgi:hypothetical protein
MPSHFDVLKDRCRDRHVRSRCKRNWTGLCVTFATAAFSQRPRYGDLADQPFTNGFRSCAGQQNQLADVRFGSKADIEAPSPDVRFTPKSGHDLSALGCPLCAKSRHWPAHSLATSSARPNGAEMVSRRASTVQSLAFRQALQVFGIDGGSAPTRREKSLRGATSQPSR